VEIDVDGSESATSVSRTARARNTVRMYDNFSPDSSGTINVSATSSDVTNTGITIFKL
jgi:hypothetical protein